MIFIKELTIVKAEITYIPILGGMKNKKFSLLNPHFPFESIF